MKEMKDVIVNESGRCDGCRNCGMGCSCGQMHGYSGHPVLRILLALAIVGFVFAAGMKLGELKAELGLGFEGGYEGHHMMDRGGDFQVYEGQSMMMPSAPQGVAVPAAPAAAPAKATTAATPATR